MDTSISQINTNTSLVKKHNTIIRVEENALYEYEIPGYPYRHHTTKSWHSHIIQQY